jgi:hypothetical protein
MRVVKKLSRDQGVCERIVSGTGGAEATCEGADGRTGGSDDTWGCVQLGRWLAPCLKIMLTPPATTGSCLSHLPATPALARALPQPPIAGLRSPANRSGLSPRPWHNTNTLASPPSLDATYRLPPRIATGTSASARACVSGPAPAPTRAPDFTPTAPAAPARCCCCSPLEDAAPGPGAVLPAWRRSSSAAASRLAESSAAARAAWRRASGARPSFCSATAAR